MGFHRWQTRKVAENAVEFLESDETPRATVICQTIGSARDAPGDVTGVLTGGDPVTAGAQGGQGYAVVATDAHIYVLELTGLTSLGGLAAKYPIDAVEVGLEKSIFRPDLRVADARLTTMAFGGKKYAQTLVDFAQERRAKSG